MATQNPDVLAAWETSSQYWNKYQTLIETMYAPSSRALAAAAGVAPGQAVLDIGGGSGEPSFTLASLVGEKGTVTYTDPSAGMVKAAQSEAEKRKLGNISFHQSSAEELTFAPDTFDAAVSRLSTMFFSDVLAGLRGMLRVLKPGGCVALLVWANREGNPFFSVVSDVLDRYVPAEPEDEDAPTAFRFARPGKLADLLREAGAKEVNEEAFSFAIEAPISVERFWELRTEMSDTFRKKLAPLDAAKVGIIRREVINAVSDYFKSGEMNFPGQVLIVTGTKA
ncbi:MAG TPA: class I SAM-dependent methyltransferase [Pyrinomonadaceae bacterium]|nr:class I SAM-dependent methyltransferase [Pyrinomonadaceae bacterium]